MERKNPILSSNVLSNAISDGRMVSGDQSGFMTLSGAIHRTGILLSLVMVTAALNWDLSMRGHPMAPVLTMVGFVGGLIACLVSVFKAQWVPVTAPIYSAAQGLVLGGVSALLNASYPGIAIQACMLTFGTLFALLGAYRFGWIRATERFKAVVFAATLGIGLVYLVSMVLGIFGVKIPMLHGSGDMALLFSVVAVVVAAMNLVMDFSFIEEGVAARAPKYMEWYAAFGLMVSLIWLYMEILKLLSILARRRD